MTREELAFEASKRFKESLTEKDLATLSKDDMCFAFQLGIKWAETHPESPWISVEDDLPYNHKNLMEDKHYTKPVLTVLTWNGVPSKKHIEICRMCDIMGSDNVEWYWRIDSHYQVVCWMPLPEMPN